MGCRNTNEKKTDEKFIHKDLQFIGINNQDLIQEKT